ncbi:MAG: bifunctional folylpolyglutamate synthase/dihydrofolate synthase [Defluviitaleaceae bacterium]|nr:bifunctional folylpolyglutamate synthase/dihydrofolate synthase [Defluviitaleaceae bacterium]
MMEEIRNIDQAKEFIFSTAYKGSVLGLERIQDLLFRIGSPQNQLKFIHVAGTNGKGSTAAMLSSVLVEAGFRVGLFTSPYIDCFTEMIQINHIPLDDNGLIALANKIRPHLSLMVDKPTEFEIITSLAFLHFFRQDCDIVVLEVGMGGRLDSTNVIDAPEVAVITNIGMDHMEFLGNTIEKIAAEKAGIIKSGAACVCYPQKESVEDVIRQKCQEQGVQAVFLKEADIEIAKRYTISLFGHHQLLNACVAISTIYALQERGWNVPKEALQQGLAKTKWAGRFEILRKNPDFIIDGAHNSQSIDAAASTLQMLYPNKKITFIIGVLADKDYEYIIKTLLPLAKDFIAVTPDNPRALLSNVLAEYIHCQGGNAEDCKSIEKGVEQALTIAEKDGVICAIGSLYLIGEVRKNLL